MRSHWSSRQSVAAATDRSSLDAVRAGTGGRHGSPPLRLLLPAGDEPVEYGGTSGVLVHLLKLARGAVA